MATTYHTFPGTVKWAKVFKTDKFGNYVIDFYPLNKDIRQAVKNTGIRNKINEDNDGELFYKFRRPHQKVQSQTGEVWEFGPPKVVDMAGDPITDLIGNGSEVEVTISVYDFNSKEHGTGKGHKLEEIRVLSLVPYVPKDTSGVLPEETPAEEVKPSKKNTAVPF